MDSIDIFKYIDPNRRYQAGDLIFTQGEAADYMYVVKSGSVDIKLNGELLETIKEGGIFGEMALIDPAPRSASAVAKTDVSLIAVDEDGFQKQVSTTPIFALQILKITTSRLRSIMHKKE